MPPQGADDERTQTALAEASRRRQPEALEGYHLRGGRYVCYSRQEDAKQFAIRCALQGEQRVRESFLHFGQIAPQWKRRQQASAPRRRQRGLQPFRTVGSRIARQREGTLKLPGPLGISREPTLEPAVGYADYGRNRVPVGPPSDVGDAVFRDDDVSQRAGHGRVGVGPGDIGSDLAALMARTAHGNDRPRVGEFVRHGDKVVLPPNTAYDSPVFERVGGDCAQQRHCQGGIDEPGMWTLSALARWI